LRIFITLLFNNGLQKSKAQVQFEWLKSSTGRAEQDFLQISGAYKKVDEYRLAFANPYVAASRGWVDDVIDPRATRAHLIRALDSLKNKFEDRPRKKHGNFPV